MSKSVREQGLDPKRCKDNPAPKKRIEEALAILGRVPVSPEIQRVVDLLTSAKHDLRPKERASGAAASASSTA